MSTPILVTGLLLIPILGGFFVYASLAMRHASRFRYLSKRSIYATLLFMAISASVILAILGTYIGILMQA